MEGSTSAGLWSLVRARCGDTAARSAGPGVCAQLDVGGYSNTGMIMID